MLPSYLNNPNNISNPNEMKKFNIQNQQNSNNNLNFNSSLMMANQNPNMYRNNQYNNNFSSNNNLNINKPKDEKILLKQNIEKILNEKLNKYGLSLKQNSYNDIFNTLNNGLDQYLKNMLEKLIIVSRARNVNLNLYSKLSEKNPVRRNFKFIYKYFFRLSK